MIRKLGLLCLIAGMTQGCARNGQWDELRGAEKRDLPSINVNGKTYKVFELSRSSNPERRAKDDPNATFAVYVVVGPGKTVYCGHNASRCKKVVQELVGTPAKAKAKPKPKPEVRKEVLDGM